jgi:chromosome segregation ATPase
MRSASCAMVEAAELELKRANADEATRTGQRSRAERAREELERRRADLRALIERAPAEAETARQARTELEKALSDHRARGSRPRSR